MKKVGFDSKKYIDTQLKEIQKRVRKHKKLYLEVGGKLLYDNHASRVLPGYNRSNKLKILSQLKDAGVIYCINAEDIVSDRRLSLKKRKYTTQARKNIFDIEKAGIPIIAIAINKYNNQNEAKRFRESFEKKEYKVVLYQNIPKYTKSTQNAIKGFQKREYIHTNKKIVILTGPAGGSGKMSIAMGQIYHELQNKNKCGFAKFESFPVWNLPINGAINLAYEAATADLGDFNAIDKLHKKYYKIEAVNYNRDIENFQTLKAISKETFPFGYKSVTDMGVNTIKEGITNLAICNKAAKKEVLYRQKRYLYEYKKGRENIKTVQRMKEIISKLS